MALNVGLGVLLGLCLLGVAVYIHIIEPAWSFIRAIERPHAFRLRNRGSGPVRCRECGKGHMARHGYGNMLVWQCTECPHVSLDGPNG